MANLIDFIGLLKMLIDILVSITYRIAKSNLMIIKITETNAFLYTAMSFRIELLTRYNSQSMCTRLFATIHTVAQRYFTYLFSVLLRLDYFGR